MKAYKDDNNTTRIAVLETIAAQINQTLIRLENKMDEGFSRIDKKFDNIERKLERMDDKIDNVRKENTSHFRTTIFTILTLIGTPLLMESIKLLTKLVHGI